MSQKVQELYVRLNGGVSAGANKIGDFLTNLGGVLDRIGGKTRQFQEESLDIYRGYEDQMLAAQYALSAQVNSTTELEKQMAGLKTAARQWAATTIFHTDDVSQAINEAAHAGWDYQEILEGVPKAMLIAQAGGLDLSEGLDYLVKMMNATKTPMSDMGTLIDQWAMAANISATNIGEMGEAFMSMGATAQFGDSTAELFSLLAALANVGTVGSQAGTALRSTLMRLIAPTTKADAAMELLGADAEELSQVLADENVTKAVKMLQGLGFSAYDTEGRLKPVKTIFEELFKLTENLDEQSRNEIMAAIFPTRTIATGLSLLTASNGELDKLYKQISNSEGYAQKGSEIMMSGLTGSVETLKSKWEEFQRSMGETLSPSVERLADKLGGIIDGINSAPPEVLSGLNSLLSTLSVAGPLILGAGAVAKMVGSLGPVGTGFLLAGAGAAYLLGYIQKLNEISFENNFGTLSLNLEELGKYVDGIETKFSTEKDSITLWSEAVAKAQENMNQAMGSMNEGLIKKVLTGGSFTEADFNDFVTLGNDIVKYTVQGIENAEAADQSFLQAIFGDKETDAESSAFEQASGLLDWYYGDLSKEAYEIGENIRKTMTKALNNGELTAEDRAAIQAQLDRLRKINAEIARRQQEEAYYSQMAMAGRVSWDSVDGFLEANAQKLAAAEEAVNAQYAGVAGALESARNRAAEEGKEEISFLDLNGNRRTIRLSEYDNVMAELQREWDAALQSERDKFGGISATAFDSLMRDSDFSDAWAFAQDYAARGADAFEGMSIEQAERILAQLPAIGKATGRLKGIMNPFADNDAVYAQIRALEAIGDGNTAGIQGDFNRLINAANINGRNTLDVETAAEKAAREAEEARLREINDLLAEAKRLDEAIDIREKALNGEGVPIFDGTTLYGDNGLYAQWTEVTDKLAALGIGPDGEPLDTTVSIGVEDEAVQEWLAQERYITVTPVIGGADGGGAADTVGGAGTGNDSLPQFGAGGRAMKPSIFGEAGTEWAIPEAHTERTAALLNAARRASGFTWGDLIARFGGLNGNPGYSPFVLNYSPVINANDASGVASVLSEDKNRVMRMIQQAMADAKFRDAATAYA